MTERSEVIDRSGRGCGSCCSPVVPDPGPARRAARQAADREANSMGSVQIVTTILAFAITAVAVGLRYARS